MAEVGKKMFDPLAFLAEAGIGRKLLHLQAKDVIFSQGDKANAVFYVQSGRAKLTVVSKAGKQATITLLSAGDFVGEEAIAAVSGPRLATATAISACAVLKISRDEMVRVIHEERSFSEHFLAFMLTKSMRTQADLVDQLFKSSEKRLARVVLLMAEFGRQGEPQMPLPKISQEALAQIIGSTRAHVSFFMNRFRKLGFLDYNGRIHVNKSLLNVVLHDQLPEDNAKRPALKRDSKNPL